MSSLISPGAWRRVNGVSLSIRLRARLRGPSERSGSDADLSAEASWRRRIDDAGVIARILKHLGMWSAGEKILTGGDRGPPGGGADPPVTEEAMEGWVQEVVDYEHYYSDPMPDYDECEPIIVG